MLFIRLGTKQTSFFENKGGACILEAQEEESNRQPETATAESPDEKHLFTAIEGKRGGGGGGGGGGEGGGAHQPERKARDRGGGEGRQRERW